MIAQLPSTVDAVVIGAGPNGLVAANRLADAGWEVLLVEAQDDLGGAVRSDREVHPDFVHDTFSAFYPMAAASPVITALDLPAYGLRWRHAPAVLGHPWPDGSWTVLHRDAQVTAALLDREHPGDGDAWLALVAQWRRIGPALVGALLSPMPPVRSGLRAALTLPGVGGLEFVQRLLSPARHTLDAPVTGRVFGGRGAPMLVAGNAAHADLASTSAGSSVIGLLLAMLGQTVGFPVPEGGAGRLTEAMAARFRSRGGEVSTGVGVDRVLVERGRAAGVVIGGTLVRSRRAVVAGVGVHQLVQHLLDLQDVPARYLDRVRRFRMDPATVKVDFALSGPVPWRAEPAYAPGTVHLCDSLDELSAYEGQLAADLIPERPFLLIGQMTTSDPTRSPAGTESLWSYTHVPQQVSGDVGGTLTGDWDGGDAERFADRMQARIETYAPGFGSRVLARRVLSPTELERRDANLVGGAVGGGSSALDQQLIFRPVPGLGRAGTPIRDLYLASASAHPGGAVHGAGGANAARAALWSDRLSRPRIRT